MSHDHADHAHGHVHVHTHGHAHGHEHVPARVAADDVASVLMRGAAARIGAALGAVLLLWGAVAWALADLST